MKKSASILDYSYPFLDPAVWDHEQKLYSYHKDFILRLLEKMYVNYKLVQPEAWITDIRIIGSLTTSKWLFTSDMDVHMVVNLAKFIELNMPGTDPKIAFEYLDSTRKEFDRAKILAPMTQHPIEYYFEVPEFITTNTSVVGVYSISQDKWLKAPVIFDADVDFEESKKQVMTQAEAIAEALDGSFGKIDRQIDRITELERMISAWDKDKQQLFYNKIEEKLKGIEAEILKDLELRQALIDARHAAQDPMADIEIKFKWLQRFGFFGILTNIKNLMTETGGQVTLDELPLLKKIVTEAANRAVKNPGIWEGQIFWSGMADAHDGQIYEVHSYQEARRADFHHSFYVSVEAQDAMRSGDAVFFWVNPDGTINTAWGHRVDEATQANDAGLREKIRSQITINNGNGVKAAFLKEALEKETETDICIDLDKTIAKPAKHPKIGEPIEGAKEALKKLQELGYKVVIYSCRSDSEEGLDSVKEYLDKHEIPYDSIFEGNKPFAKFYIDDRAIQFDNWDNVLKQVEKSEKKASLHVTATIDQKYWIDPSGKEYPVDPMQGHYKWVAENILKQPWNKSVIDAAVEKTEEMIQQGWTRITTESDYDFAIEVADIDHVPSYLDNFIAQHYTGGGVEIDDQTGEYQDIQDPFPSIQKQINKARRMRLQPAAKAFSKKEIKAHKYDILGDPSLRQGPARAVFNFVQKGVSEFGLPDLDMFDVLGDHPRYGSTLNRKEIEQLNIPITEDKVAKQAKTKKIKQGEYSCVMASIPHGIAQEIVEFGVREIPDEDLYVDEDGNLGRELQAHVTIMYGLLTDDAKSVRRSFNHTKPFKAKLGKVRHFQPPERDFDVVTVEVISDDLTAANAMIEDKFKCADDLPSSGEYKPHVTIAYVKRDAAKKHIGSDEFEGIEIELDTLVFSPRVGNKMHFSIGANKKHASWDAPGYWIDPKGNIFDSHGEGLVHNEWVLANLEMLQKQYGIKVPPDLLQYQKDYFETLQTDDGDNIDMPASDEVWIQMLKSGWVRVGDADEGVGVELNSLRAIPSFLDSILAEDLYEGALITVEDINHNFVQVEYPFTSLQKAVNQALRGQKKKSEFLPSLFNAPDNKWQMAEGGDDKEIALNPDSVSDETTDYAPCTTGKPRTKDVWRQFISMFSNLFSKNDTTKIESALEEDLVTIGNFNAGKYGKIPIEVPQDLLDKYFSIVIYFKQLLRTDPDGQAITKLDHERTKVHNALMNFAFKRMTDKNPEDFPMAAGTIRHQIAQFIEDMIPRDDLPKTSAYDPALEEIEKNELGEDQTAHEYSKDFKDLNLIKKPHNTTWDSLTQDGEPSKPTSVTYSPQISNEDNLDQNSPGGYPRRFMGKPKGEYSSTEGEVNNALIQMLRNRTAMIESTTTDITKEAFLDHAYWIDPKGQAFEVRGAENNMSDYSHYDWISDHQDTLQEIYGLHDITEREELVDAGWVRIGDSSTDNWQVEVADINHVPSFIDNILAQFATDGAQIDFADHNENFIQIQWPWKNVQAAINRALRAQSQLPMAASLNKTAITKQYAIYVNNVAYPAARTLTRGKAIRIVKERFPEAYAKGLYEIREEEFKTSSLKLAYLAHAYWISPEGQIYEVRGSNGGEKTHYDWALKNQKLLQEKYGIKFSNSVLDKMIASGWVRIGDEQNGEAWQIEVADLSHIPSVIDNALAQFVPEGASIVFAQLKGSHVVVEYPFKSAQLAVNRALRQPVAASLKEAGSQSASVPDYLCDEWKTEQIMNDTDEEPYVNHDQRDYPYGMHDSPENTDSGIGWPKDNQPLVVHLDTLENPAFRNDPFGIGEYHITYYNAMPASDGIEQTNEE